MPFAEAPPEALPEGVFRGGTCTLAVSEARRQIKARLQRTQLHFDALESKIREFVEGEDSYLVEPEQRADTNKVVLWGTALRNPPLLAWTPIVSDVVHGLRASLDNLLWAISLREQRRLGLPTPRARVTKSGPFKRWLDISFPIVIDNDKWAIQSERKLWAISDHARQIIRELQPFATASNAPEREPLAVVQEIWNIDKHRHVPLVSVWTGGDEIEIRIRPSIPLPGLRFNTTWMAPRRTLKLHKKTELAHAEPTGIILPGTAFAVEMDHGIPFDIVFKRGYPGFGMSVMDILEAAQAGTEQLLNRVEPFLK